MTAEQKTRVRLAIIFGIVGTIISVLLDYFWRDKGVQESLITLQTLFRLVVFTGVGYYIARPKNVEKQ
jgi:uncharacterized membrane protein